MSEYNSAYTGAQIDAAVGAVREKESTWDAKASMEEVNTAIDEKIAAIGENGSGDMSNAILYTNTLLPMETDGETGYPSVAYGNGMYVSVSFGENIIAYSTDGLNWNKTVPPEPTGYYGYWYAVAFGNNMFVAVSADGDTAYSYDGINWTVSKQAIELGEAYSIAYGNGTFVITAQYLSKSFYSTDGINWTATDMPAERRWKSVAYGNGKFVAVDYKNTGIIAYSSDGIDWTEKSVVDSSISWGAITYGDNKFVILDTSNGISAYSADGVNWTQSTIPQGRWYCVTYGNGKFVAISQRYAVCAYSTDGVNWIETNIPSEGAYWYSVVYGSDKFVVVGDYNLTAYSSDGVNWVAGGQGLSLADGTSVSEDVRGMIGAAPNEHTHAPRDVGLELALMYKSVSCYFTYYEYPKMVYGGGTFVAAGSKTDWDTGEVICEIRYSEDGTTWERASLPFAMAGGQVCIAYGDYKFVLLSNAGSGAYSRDGRNWTQIEMPSTIYWQSITYGNGTFVAMGSDDNDSGKNVAAYSTDGTTWETTPITGSYSAPTSIAYGGGRFVALDNSGNTVFCSEDEGRTWEEESLTQTYDAIAYGGGEWVMLGYDAYAHSYDGVYWDEYQSESDLNRSTNIIYGENVFVALGSGDDGTKVLYSTDYGNSWETSSAPYLDSWSSIAFCNRYGEEKFIAIANDSDTMLISTDGINWRNKIQGLYTVDGTDVSAEIAEFIKSML